MSLSKYRYYLGTKVSGPYAYQAAKATVHYQMVASWHNTGRSHTVRCGASSVMTGSHEVGVELTELERFTATVGSSIGVEGIASLKSEMESATEIQVKWQEKKTNTDTFNIPAPECGCQTWVLFQLVRDYRFTIETPRLFRRPRMDTAEVREKTFHFDLLIDDDREDPACPCPGDDHRDKGEILSLQIGNLGIRVDAFPTADNQFRFRIGQKSYAVDAGAIRSAPVSLTLDDVPQIVRDLSGISGATIEASVDVVPAFERSDLWSAEGVSPLATVPAESGRTKSETD